MCAAELVVKTGEIWNMAQEILLILHLLSTRSQIFSWCQPSEISACRGVTLIYTSQESGWGCYWLGIMDTAAGADLLRTKDHMPKSPLKGAPLMFHFIWDKFKMEEAVNFPLSRHSVSLGPCYTEVWPSCAASQKMRIQSLQVLKTRVRNWKSCYSGRCCQPLRQTPACVMGQSSYLSILELFI